MTVAQLKASRSIGGQRIAVPRVREPYWMFIGVVLFVDDALSHAVCGLQHVTRQTVRWRLGLMRALPCSNTAELVR